MQLNNALYAPSFPTCLFSVRAATEKGATVTFRKDSAFLIAPDGNKFPIAKENNLYYFHTSQITIANKASMSLNEWHRALGHQF